MKLSKTARTLLWSMLLLPMVGGGCRVREPWGGCPFEDVEVSQDFTTPWGTTLEHDMAQLVGPHGGTFAWRDGDDVITVPKAGEEHEVEAIVELDPMTAMMRVYESTEDTPVCESDFLSMQATVSFVRLDDGGVELTTPVTITRKTDWSRYLGEAELESFAELDPDLVALQDFEHEQIVARMSWNADGTFSAEYDYHGSSSSSSGSGYGVSKLVAEFFMAE